MALGVELTRNVGSLSNYDFAVPVKDDTLSKAIANTINRAPRSVARQLDRRLVRDCGSFQPQPETLRNLYL